MPLRGSEHVAVDVIIVMHTGVYTSLSRSCMVCVHVTLKQAYLAQFAAVEFLLQCSV